MAPAESRRRSAGADRPKPLAKHPSQTPNSVKGSETREKETVSLELRRYRVLVLAKQWPARPPAKRPVRWPSQEMPRCPGNTPHRIPP